MTSKDKHALDTLPKRIDELTGTAAKLRRALADPGLYGRDPVGFARVSTGLAKAEAELSAAEEQWLDLEMRRENLQAS